jgi:hypothetical protein
VGINCLNWRAHRGEKGRGEGGSRADSARLRRRPASAGKKKRKGGEGRLTGGPRLSAPRGKKKKGRGSGGLAREWAGPPGSKGAGAVFFLFFFQTSFSNHFSSQIQIKLFQTFLKNFIDFLETTQATKNHASQKMMHIHLLSLSLLNYL